MGESEAGKLLTASSCHAVHGDATSGREELKLEGLDFIPSMFDNNNAHSSSNTYFKNTSGSNSSTTSVEVEEGELIEGIEANDVSGLLEQFLEYEEKQGSLDSSLSPSSHFENSASGLLISGAVNAISDSNNVTHNTPDLPTVALKISLLEGAENSSLDVPLKNGRDVPDPLDVEAFKNLQDLHGLAVDGLLDDIVINGKDEVEEFSVDDSSVRNGCFKDEQGGGESAVKRCFDNHDTDHNYACRGFPRRTPSVSPEVGGHSERSKSKYRKSRDSDSRSENENVNKRKISNGSERKKKCLRKRRLSCDGDDDSERNRRSPQRLSNHHYKKRSRRDRSSSDEENDSRRRHRERRSHSTFSSDDRNCSSLDEDSMNERRKRYNPRGAESSSLHRRRSSRGSDRDSCDSCSDNHRRRKRRSRRSSADSHDKDGDELNKRPAYDIEQKRKMGFKFDHEIKNSAKEERRIVYIGKIARGTTEDDIWRRFRPFGPIEKVTVHFRDKGDNYAFVTFFEPSSAAEAIEQGNDDSSLPVLDICFGGRRKFCGGSYVDFDSNTSYLEEHEISRPPSPDEMDFDTLLKMSQKNLKGRKDSCKGR